MAITSTAPATTANGHAANASDITGTSRQATNIGHTTTGTSRQPTNNGHSATSNGQRLPAASVRSQSPSSRPAVHPGVLQLLRQVDAAEREQQPASPLPSPIATGAPAGFTAEQVASLAAPLDRARISSREQGRGRVNYLQSWVVIHEANRIFGFDGWQRQTVSCRCVNESERAIGRDQKRGWGVTYIARVRISVLAGSRGLLIREGTGAGHGIDTDLGLVHESAIKEAETDAMKRALVTFGNPFGLALYDKSQRQVTGAMAAGQGTAAGNRVRGDGPANALARPAVVPQTPTPVRAASQEPTRPTALTPAHAPAVVSRGTAVATGPAPNSPLDPTAIQALQERIRGLLPPQLTAFSQAFRFAFQVPDSTPSIAGLITEQRHRLWIEQVLRQGPEQLQAGDA